MPVPAAIEQDAQLARSILIRAGIPERTLKKAERHGQVDWEPLANALDDMFMIGHGETTQLAFLAARDGSGRTTLQLLERPGGAKLAHAAACRWLERRS